MSENTTAAQTPSINDTLLQALTEAGISSYTAGSALAKAEELLKEREYTIAETIVNEADVQFGYGQQARTLLEAAGLNFRPVPEPVVEEAPAEAESDEAKLDQILALVKSQGETVEKLVAAANRNGITL